jgi:dUTPase
MKSQTFIVLNNLLNIYERVMVLKMFVDSPDEELHTKYVNAAKKHNYNLLNKPTHIDAGFDLFAPGYGETNADAIPFYGPGHPTNNSPVNKLDLKVCCSAQMYLDSGKEFNTGYYMYPRSSLSKTQIRLANSTGIIDAGYRGHLMGMFDVVNIVKTDKPDASTSTVADFYGAKYERYLQICAPSLVPIVVEIVNSQEELGEQTERGAGGFGSTGR